MASLVYPIYPCDLMDAEWAELALLIPAAKPGGRPRSVNLRRILNRLFYLLRTVEFGV
jgi:putative transposase